MSKDGESWERNHLPVETGELESIACDTDACYALVSQRNTSVHLLRTPFGKDVWTPVHTFARAATAEALVRSRTLPDNVKDFVVCGLLPTADGLLVTGFGFSWDYRTEWSASFILAADGAYTSPVPFDAGKPRSGRDVVCQLVQAPDNSRWAAGSGAFRFENGAWRRLWRYPGPDRPPE